MAVKAGQPQVQCDKQVSARTYVAAARPTCWQEDTLQHVWDECVNSSALKEKIDIFAYFLSGGEYVEKIDAALICKHEATAESLLA